MSDEVEIDVRLNKETVDKLNRMTKKELINRICVIALEAKVANDEKIKAQRVLKNEREILQTKLDKSEAYIEQGRAMIEAVMERWYEYDA